MKRQKPKPAAFMSYVHLDDEYGHVTRFYERLSHEVGVYIGEEFLIFRDREEILLGQSWKERIEESLDEVTFLIPIITPHFFSSEACRGELQQFIEREKKLGRNDLILPVYYVDCSLLNDEGKRAGDELAQVIAARQYADWRELRHEPFTSPHVGKTLAQLAVQIRDAMERVQACNDCGCSSNSNSKTVLIRTPLSSNEYLLDNGERIYLSAEKVASGGEAHLYKTSQHGYLAKIYKKPKGWQEKAVKEIAGKYNVVANHPDVSDLFCWPKAVIVKPKLGVLIPEAPPNLRDVNINFLLFPKSFKTIPSDRRGDWKMRVKIALKMARSMRYLHGSGLCHADISFNNILVDPRTGEMRWIDLDGLVIPGYPHHRPAVGGTLRYMAPELTTGNAEPSINTDLHSLAVLIYELLLMNHPLLRPGRLGRKDISKNDKIDIDALELGKHALYVEHPTNKDNRPIGDYIGSSVLGKEIQELMRRTFVGNVLIRDS